MEDVDKVDLSPPLFVKPVAEGTSKGISAASKILNRQELAPACGILLKQFRQPVLVETFLPGREFTVGIAGTGDRAEVLGTIEVILHPQAEADVYSYRNKEECEDLVHYKLVSPENDEQVRRSEEIALKFGECWDAATQAGSICAATPMGSRILSRPILCPACIPSTPICRFYAHRWEFLMFL